MSKLVGKIRQLNLNFNIGVILLNKEFKKHIETEDINNSQKLLKYLPDGLDKESTKEYYKAFASVFPSFMKMISDLPSHSLGRNVINSNDKTIDILNELLLIEENPIERKNILWEISRIQDRNERESDKQRKWLAGIAIVGAIAISGKPKEAGKKIIEVGMDGLKKLKG